MQRHMQNISFLVIIAVLLGCGFLFSQQTDTGMRVSSSTATPSEINQDKITDLPDCSLTSSPDEREVCFENAVTVSNHLLNSAVNAILDYELDPDERIAFMDVQLAWEAARDAECAYVSDREDDPQEARIKEAICLHDQNMARLTQLEEFFCDWYGSTECN
jgi:uncharacterized protein YecT (DUF1311 family)